MSPELVVDIQRRQPRCALIWCTPSFILVPLSPYTLNFAIYRTMSSKHKLCFECFSRSRINPSGRANCNGRTPCKWCSNKKLSCLYDYIVPAAEHPYLETHLRTPTPTCVPGIPPPTTSKANNPLNTVHTGPRFSETKLFVSRYSNGTVNMHFDPNPENLGTVDPEDLGVGDLDPDDLPAENYEILLNAYKRKRVLELTVVKDFPHPAKRIRGGAENDGLAAEINAPHNGHTPPPAPAPAPPAPAVNIGAQFPAPNIGVQAQLDHMNATTLMCLELMAEMRRD
ncbi:hypothetical protein RSOLAG1IB_10351 [Rhizoctonia solani AG-1 IB]|uniref:Zn(2)-C6 fungal-type domain-containing protein n=2 Tax=Thanatephorus cucumeris (strain AG1-IB / isolate 7/3/14) TaxID=1108050 RepID=A0A0B7G1F5_THACB|nr:hypothetical protein RSOLAG1IB_10351 [Rhizoctonia solani AG-1 IB]